MKNRRRYVLFALGVLLIIGVLALFFAPLSEVGTQITPNPATSYDDAQARVAAISKSEDADVMPECHSFTNTVGKKTTNVIVVFHGYTNCPIQYKQFSDQLVAQGYNVVVLRMPHHGEKNRSNNNMESMTNQEIAQFANTSVDIADGLGENVYVTGLSVGGNITSWAAQTRSDVKGYVNMAPFYAPKYVPEILIKPLVRILNVLPPINFWWDPKTKQNNATGSPYAYPGYDSKSMAKFLSFGVFTKQIIANGAHGVKQTLVLNENDGAINNNVAKNEEQAIFTAMDKYNMTQYIFAKNEKLNHDIIDPYNPEQRLDYVYPILIGLINSTVASK